MEPHAGAIGLKSDGPRFIELSGGVCPFTDVEKDEAATVYPDNFVAVCAAHGIATGTTATTFNPTGSIVTNPQRGEHDEP